MRVDAASAGTVEMHGNNYPLVQLLTVDDILKGKRARLPLLDPNVAYRRAERTDQSEQGSLI